MEGNYLLRRFSRLPQRTKNSLRLKIRLLWRYLNRGLLLVANHPCPIPQFGRIVLRPEHRPFP